MKSKIELNYDLLGKISEANSGFSLSRCVKRGLVFSVFSIPYGMIDNAVLDTPLYLSLIECSLYLGLVSVITAATTRVLKSLTVEISKNDLKKIVKQFKVLDINTNSDLLNQAHKYKTDYSFSRSEDGWPVLKENKYIMVPTITDCESNETPIIQEHVVGTRNYSVSRGEHIKVFELSKKNVGQN